MRRMAKAQLSLMVLALAAFGQQTVAGVAADPDPRLAPRVQAGDMRYAGAFRVPDGDRNGCNFSTGAHCFTYGGVFGLGPNGDSLYLRGHAWVGGVGEVSLPATFTLTMTATVRQDIADLAEGVEVDPGESNEQGPFAGLVFGGRLIVSGSTYYDADGTQVNTHGVSGLDFAQTGDFQGWYRFSPALAANPRSIGGAMTPIPPEWRALLGGPALTGNCCLSIIGNSSSGPSVTVFDPDAVGLTSPLTGTTLLFYPLSHPLAVGTTQNDLFSLTTQIAGLAFPPGTRSLLFIGRHGTGPYCYGDGAPCNDPCDGSKGTHAYPYRHQVWAYDAVDLLAVKNGALSPWAVRPYATWILNDMDSSGCARVSGAAYDPARSRLYVAAGYGEQPIIHVYTLTAPGSALPVRVLLPGVWR